MDKSTKNIAIVGAGVIGTTTAKLLQEKLRNVNINIFSEKFHNDTTSYVAAGIFMPGTGFRGPTEDITKKWVNDSFYYWENIVKSPDAARIGVMPCPTYVLSKINPHVTQNPLIEDLCPIYRKCSDDEIKKRGPDWRIMDKTTKNIAIVGAGVIGTTTAKLLQEQLRNVNITIFAEKFHNETVSYVAAGLFRPGTGFRGPTKEITKQWVNDSWYYWENIIKSPDAARIGVMPCPTYVFSKNNPHVTHNSLIEDLCPIYRKCSDDEIKKRGPDWRYGAYFTTNVISCARYIPWTENNFINNGGKIVNRKIESISTLSSYDLVFNCTGFGAKYLCNDEQVIPIRGQVFKVRAPWLKAAYYGDFDTYVIPGLDGVATLGGTRQYDNYNLEVCKHDAAGIMERCVELVPQLKNVEIVSERVGLRPYRSVVRVEPEIVNNVKVVHCYGHGGYGVTCAPGTAAHAVNIGMDLLRSNARNKL